MEPRREMDIAAELLALRPTPSPAFSAKLDERAAAGFPRRSPRFGFGVGRLVARLRAVRPKRALVAAGATALTGIVVATAVVALTNEQAQDPSPSGSGTALLSYPSTDVRRLSRDLTPFSYDGSGANAKRPFRRASGNGRNAPSVAYEGVSSSVIDASKPLANGNANFSSPASSAAGREVERSARIVLATDASEVRGAVARVLETVHSYDGIVMRSAVRDGGEEAVGAVFQLLIPSRKLGDAMAAFSEIAAVRSRSEATADVTAPAIGLEQRLRDARAKVESLLAELATAETETERQALEAKLRAKRRDVAMLRSVLARLQRRTQLSNVSLRIETGGGADGSAGWGIGDAVGDAGHILSVAAGVTLLCLAVLGPLALIFLLAWLARRAWARRARERVLGQARP